MSLEILKTLAHKYKTNHLNIFQDLQSPLMIELHSESNVDADDQNLDLPLAGISLKLLSLII